MKTSKILAWVGLIAIIFSLGRLSKRPIKEEVVKEIVSNNNSCSFYDIHKVELYKGMELVDTSHIGILITLHNDSLDFFNVHFSIDGKDYSLYNNGFL